VVNERLKAAMTRAGMEPDQLAALIEVEVKTIRRWLAGTIPYPRHRTRVARALRHEPHELWPELEPPVSDLPAADGSDLLQAFARGDDDDLPELGALLSSASARIDLLDLTLGYLIDVEFVGVLAARADAGCRVRILVSDPDSAHLLIANAELDPAHRLIDRPALTWELERTLGYLQPVLPLAEVHARTFVASRFNSIARVDDEMLVRLHLYATTPSVAPALHLARRTEHGLFDRFAAHYDQIWEHAATPLTPDPERYPDPDEHPDRYQPPTP
jgi:lambda repressor-like predicted transcriptional regulator